MLMCFEANISNCSYSKGGPVSRELESRSKSESELKAGPKLEIEARTISESWFTVINIKDERIYSMPTLAKRQAQRFQVGPTAYIKIDNRDPIANEIVPKLFHNRLGETNPKIWRDCAKLSQQRSN
ncbi:hypothetical protein EVAR_63152_1 [Eumeta japonica]|uniref:Uncharacterized protein n=1 Tax=Eumeta variegata TaxID=151549 RepID=A0A4C1ZWC8_EUMVA|nr:hypothetical protein EVAR_63152_1 [Eumeta japonica]